MKFGRLLFVPLFAFLLAACGGGDETVASGVASAADLEETTEDSTPEITETAAEVGAGEAELTAEEAGLALAECMRENGVADFPDPEIDENGNLNLRAAITDSGVDAQTDTFREQITVCRDEVGADNFGAGARGNAREGVQEQLLVYTQCLRDEGLDVGDLGGQGQQGQGQQGQGQQAQGDGANGDGDGQGRARGNGGAGADRGARIAQALGLDADDPTTQAALAACNDVLEQAFANAGVGGQAPAANDT